MVIKVEMCKLLCIYARIALPPCSRLSCGLHKPQVQQIIDSNVHIRRQYYAQERARSGMGMRCAAPM